MISVIAGAVAPEYLLVEITRPAGETLDLTTVTSVTLDVRAPRRQTWSTVIQSQSATQITCKHEWAAGDVDEPGEYRVYALLTLSGGGTRRAGWTAFQVIGA